MMLGFLGFMMVVLSVLSYKSHAQSNLEVRINSIRENYKEHTNEKLYLQTDRDFYAVGDTILVRAFLFPEPSPKISDGESRFIYLDLVNDEGKVLNREKIIIDTTTNIFSGYVRLYNNVKHGKYEIQAYTYWMQNRGKESFFTKKIFVSDSPFSGLTIGNENDLDSNLCIEFFPEGGSLIHGKRQKVAFKIDGYNILSENFSGYIEDENGTRITDIEPDIYGFGIFYLIPDCNNKYYAKLKSGDEDLCTFALPETKGGNAIAINIESSVNNPLKYQLLATQDIAIDDKYILIYTDKDIVALIDAKERGALSIDSTVKEGILYFAVIDKNGDMYSCRAWYIENVTELQPQLSLTLCDNRQTELKISIQDLMTSANLAVSIVPLKYLTEESLNHGIHSYVTACSELSFDIPNPQFYLESNNKINDLLIVQKPKFNSLKELEDLLDRYNSNGFTKESDMILEGYVINRRGKKMTNNIVKRSGQLIRNGVVSLRGEDYMTYFVYPDNNGYFKRGEIFWDNETRFFSDYETYAGVRDIYLDLNEPTFLNEFDYSYLAMQNTKPKVDKHSDEWTDSQERRREKHRVYGADMYMISPSVPGGPITSSYNNPELSQHTTSKFDVKASKSYIRAKNRPSMRRLIEFAPQKKRTVGYNKEMTLYWNENVTIDSATPLVVSIPQKDKTQQEYAIIINGITTKGLPIEKTWIIK